MSGATSFDKFASEFDEQLPGDNRIVGGTSQRDANSSVDGGALSLAKPDESVGKVEDDVGGLDCVLNIECLRCEDTGQLKIVAVIAGKFAGEGVESDFDHVCHKAPQGDEDRCFRNPGSARLQ